MGGNYSTGLALFWAFDRAVIQPIRRLFPRTSNSIEGTPQIVNLDEECVEGPVPYHFGNACTCTRGTQQVEKAKQYQSTMTFQLNAVKKKAVKVEKPMKFVFGYVDGDSSETLLLRKKKILFVWLELFVSRWYFTFTVCYRKVW
jgi:hypothetical protein